MTTSLLHIYSSITMCFTNSTKKPWKCWELNTQTLSIWTPAITVYMPVGGGEKGAQQGVALLSLRPGGLCFGLTPERCHLWPGSAQFDAFKLVMEKKITKAKSPTRGIRGGEVWDLHCGEIFWLHFRGAIMSSSHTVDVYIDWLKTHPRIQQSSHFLFYILHVIMGVPVSRV